MIKLHNIKKIYKSKVGNDCVALNNINLTLGDKGMVFILGKSGSGKSTLLNVMAGLDNYNEGDLYVDEKNTKYFDNIDFDNYRNSKAGFIFQEFNLIESLNVEENIQIAFQLYKKDADKQQIKDVLKAVDLVGYEKRKINELSGGQKQRVAIARVLIKNCEIIFADEPTGNLDSKTGDNVFKYLKEFSKNKLVIIVTHDKENADRYADRIIEIADSEVIDDKHIGNYKEWEFNKNTEKSSLDYREKSHLPTKYSLHLTFANMKNKIRKLIMTSVLLIIAITMMGLSISFADFNITYIMNRSIEKNDIDALFIYEGRYDEGLKQANSTYAYSLSDKFYNDFKNEFPEIDLFKVYGGSFIGYKDKSSQETVIPTICEGIADIKSLEDLQKLGFKGLMAGKMPEPTQDMRYTEVLLTDVMFLLNLLDPSSVMLQWMFQKDFMFQLQKKLFENIGLFTREEIKVLNIYFSSLNDSEGIDYSKNTAFFKAIVKAFPIFADFFVNYSGRGDYFYIADSFCGKIVGLIETKNFDKFLSLSSEILNGTLNETSFITLKNGEELQFLMNEYESTMVYAFTNVDYLLNNNAINHVNFGSSTIKSEAGVFPIEFNPVDTYRYFVNIKYDSSIATKENIIKLRNGYKFVNEEFIAPLSDKDGNYQTTLINNDVILNKKYFINLFGEKAYTDFETRDKDYFVEVEMKNARKEVYKILKVRVVGITNYKAYELFGAGNDLLKDLFITRESYHGYLLPLDLDSNTITKVLNFIEGKEYCHKSKISRFLYDIEVAFIYLALVFFIFSFIIGIFSCVLLFNFVSQSLIDRTNDIGMLRSLGTSKIDIAKIFILETFGIVILSIIIASIALFGTLSFFNNYLLAQVSKMVGLVVSSIKIFYMRPEYILFIGLGAIFVGIVACLSPIIKILRMKPAESIKKIIT